jgi:hypothetical protein
MHVIGHLRPAPAEKIEIIAKDIVTIICCQRPEMWTVRSGRKKV